jgi:pentatricopeptide repeat protein
MPAVTYRYQVLKESLTATVSATHASGDPRRAHALTVVSGLAGNGYLASLLVTRYSRLGDPNATRGVFDAAVAASSFSSASSAAPPKALLYNSMLRGYLSLGLQRQAAALFRDMPPSCVPDRHTYHLTITACVRGSSPEEIELGRRIEADATARGLASDLLVGTALIGMHAKASDIGAARRLFDRMPRRDTVAWNMVIGGNVCVGFLGEAVGLFSQMRSVDGA